MNSPICTKSTQTERETCSRCGGTGRMPFSVYNGLCFKCHGVGFALTKRGVAAENYLRALRSQPARELKVGQSIRVQSITASGSPFSYFAPITAIETITAETSSVKTQVNGVWQPADVGQIKITTTSAKFGGNVTQHEPDAMIRVAQTAEQKAETLAKALAYQDTLTKAGKPRK